MAAGILRQVERELLSRLKATRTDKSACEIGRLLLDLQKEKKRPKQALDGGAKTHEKTSTAGAGLPEL